MKSARRNIIKPLKKQFSIRPLFTPILYTSTPKIIVKNSQIAMQTIVESFIIVNFIHNRLKDLIHSIPILFYYNNHI